MADEKKSKMETASLEELLAGREKAKADNNFIAVNDFNRTLKKRFNYTDPVPEGDKPIPEREGGFLQQVRNQAPDLGASLASGLYRGAAQIADLPADVAQLATTGIEAGTKFLTGKPPSENLMSGITAGMEALPLVGDIRKYSGAVASAAERAAPELYNYDPQSFEGDVLQTTGEFAIGMGRRPVAQALVPAAAVETVKASKLPENVKLPLEIASMVLAPSVYKNIVSPSGGKITGQTKKALQLLSDEGVFPSAGQATGSKSAMLIEEGSAAGQALQEQALRNFTKAAFKRIGVTKFDNLGSDMEAAYRRIGNDLDVTIGAVKPKIERQDAVDLARVLERYSGQASEMLRSPVFEEAAKSFVQAYRSGKPISTEQIRYLHQTLNPLTRRGDETGVAAREMMPVIKDVIFRALPKDARKQWVNANKEYRDFLALESALAKRNNVAEALITPAALAQSTRSVFGQRAFVFGKNDLSELAQAGQLALKQQGTSNTAERLMAQAPTVGAGTMGAAALDVLSGNQVGNSAALYGAALGMAGIPARNRAMATPTGQAYLRNQLIGELDEGILERSLMQYLASGGLQ